MNKSKETTALNMGEFFLRHKSERIVPIGLYLEVHNVVYGFS